MVVATGVPGIWTSGSALSPCRRVAGDLDLAALRGVSGTGPKLTDGP